MRVLIAVVSCQAKAQMRDVIRETWVTKLPEGVDYKFFVGRQAEVKEDEVSLDCDDSYSGLIEKVREIARWAFDHGYDYFLKCDDDVVIKPVEMLSSGFDQHEFVGCDNGDFYRDVCHTCGKTDCRQITGKFKTPWGFNYWVGSTGMVLLCNAELPTHGANDECWVAHVLGENGILLHHDDRYIIHTGLNPNVVGPRDVKDDVVYIDKQYTVPRQDRPGRVRTVRERLAVPAALAPKQETNWLDASRFVEVQATEKTFSFCIHLVWGGYHATPQEKIIAEFMKVYSDSACVWFDRRCFGEGTWRKP